MVELPVGTYPGFEGFNIFNHPFLNRGTDASGVGNLIENAVWDDHGHADAARRHDFRPSNAGAVKLSFQNLGSGGARVQVIEQPAKQTDLAVIGRVAEHELRELLRHRAQVNRRIVVLRKTIRAVLGDEATRDSRTPAVIRLTPRKREGITHTCRLVLTQASLPMTVRELAEAIRTSHPSAAASQRDLLASISAVLRYLLESGEANNTFNDDGNRTWFAVKPPRENDLST